MAIDPKLQAMIDKVVGKRPKTVVDYIVKNGHVTNEDLKNLGYNHPPRAIRDVRECGIPLETLRVKDSTGRSIAKYVFGDPSKIECHKLGGRKTFSKAFKLELLQEQGLHCAITGEPFEERYLSIDHRVPYEVVGDQVAAEDAPEAFMLISATAQRQKSWSCEHCFNWKVKKDPDVCRRCFWASPEDYDHIAMEQRRRVTLVWTDKEVAEYEKLAGEAKQKGMSVSDYIRGMIPNR